MANTHSLDLESGSSQYSSITDGDQTGLDLSGDNTQELWIKFESVPTSGNIVNIIDKWLSSAGNRSYFLSLVNDSGTLKLNAQLSDDSSNADLVRWNWTPSTGVWYHIAVTTDISEAVATQFEFFLDTVSQGNGSVISDDGATSIFNGGAPFSIGRSANASNYLDALVNSLRVWSDIRSDAEIAANWKTTTPAGDNLQGSWYYNDDHLDDSGNGNTLVPSGSPVFSTDVPYPEKVAGNFFALL